MEERTITAEACPCAVPAETKVETPEGALTVGSLANKPAALMTRTDAGQVRFAMMKDICKLPTPQPTLRITLTSGAAFRIGVDQVLLKRRMVEIKARDLQVGDELEAVFAFPEGYVYKTDNSQEITSRASLVVTQIEPAGEAEAYSFRINRTGRFVLSAGVFGKAAGT